MSYQEIHALSRAELGTPLKNEGTAPRLLVWFLAKGYEIPIENIEILYTIYNRYPPGNELSSLPLFC